MKFLDVCFYSGEETPKNQRNSCLALVFEKIKVVHMIGAKAVLMK